VPASEYQRSGHEDQILLFLSENQERRGVLC